MLAAVGGLPRLVTGHGGFAQLMLAVGAVVLAGAVVMLGRSRSRAALMADRPGAAHRSVWLAGVLVAGSCVATVVTVPTW